MSKPSYSSVPQSTPGRRKLTPAQRGIWYAQQLAAENPMYQIAQYVDIRGSVDLRILGLAVRGAVAETDALNVRFEEDENGPYQLTAASGTGLVVTDLRSRGDQSGTKAAERAHQLMDRDVGTARDVGRDQLLRTEIFLLSEDRCFFYQRVHHLMLDGYAAVLVLKRVAQLYDRLLSAPSSEEGPGLGPGTSSFPSLDELLADESAYADSRHAAADREYWQNNLAHAEPVSGLAGHPVGTASELIRFGAVMPSGLADQLAAAAGTAPAVLLATVAIYLHKMTGERDVSVGLPVTARRGALAKSVPSMLSNIVPVRLRISPEKTVEETVAAMGAALRKALIHQRFRYESLTSASSYVGPSVNILPVLDDLRFGAANGTMNVLSTGPIDDLSIVIHGMNNTGSSTGSNTAPITVQFEANAALYSRDRVADHLQRFIRLLTELTSAPNVSVANVSLTSSEEAQQLLDLGAADTAELPSHTVVEEFRARAAATPKARAVVAADGTLDFAELDRRSNQLAHLLRSQGAGPATSIAVRLDRTTLLPIAILAVLKSGAAYLPLDPDYPAGRVEGMLEDAAPLLLLSSTALAQPEDADTEVQTSTPVLALDSELVTSALAARPDGYPSFPSASQHDLAYIIFTSGSTGRPKAVGVEHRALLNLFIGHRQDIFAPAVDRLGRTLRVAHTAGLSFDASWDPMLWLFAGHELHLVDDQTRRDPEALMEYLLFRQIDSIETTPSFVKVLLAQGLFEASTHPSVLALGGEAIDVGLWGVLARIEGVSAYNFYGPTETTVDSMTAAIKSGTGPTLGSSVLNSRHYILDAGLNPLPAHAVGELYVAGANVARGYLDKPQLSAKSFIADPFASDGSRMYRTGDVVRRLSDGNVEFLGRIDEQVKIRGFRIEPSEIEEVLIAEDGVQQAAVIVTKNRAGYDQLLAYVTASRDLDTASLRGAARRKLPDYMVPSAIVQLAEIPLTPNGKLERKALPQPEENAPALEPRNDAERLVAGAFMEVLGLTAVGIDDDFFELGGHSLLATRLVSVLRERHGSAPSLRTVFEFPTVADLAERLTPAESTDNPLLPQRRPDRIPLSYAQRRLWFLNRFDPTSGAYNIPIVLRLNGPLAVPELRQAINDVVGRHESLRTIFPFNSGAPEQLVRPAAEAEVELTAIHLTPDRLEHVLKAESGRGFNLSKDLPLRAILLQLNAREHVLLITLHHISSDGWSLAPLARDLSVAYNSRIGGTAPEFPPMPVQYADYTLWQRSELGHEEDPQSPISRQLTFWATELADAPEELRLPYDYPRGSRVGSQATVANDDDGAVVDDGAESLKIGVSKSVPVDIGAQTHQRLVALGRAHNASLFMVLQAAFAALLTKLGAGTDIPIGTPVAGRVDTKLEELVGFFVNTLVLRTDTSGNPSAADLIEGVRFTNLRAYANQDAPFERVVEELNPARSQDRHPLFQVMLTLQSTAPARLALEGIAAEVDQAPEPGGTKFDLLLDLAERAPEVEPAGNSAEDIAAGLSGSLSFDPALFTVSTATDLARRFVAVVEHFARQPEAPLSRIPVLRPDEVRHVLEQAQAESSNNNGTVLDEFAATAARHPDAAALNDTERSLTFRELDARVGMLALGLAASGVQPGDRVLVALPRRIDAVASALAVLRAGAVYVPVDLSYPAERIRMIIHDSAPRLVINETGFGPGTQDGGPEATDIAALLEAGRTVANEPAGINRSVDSAGVRYPRVSPADPAYVIYTSGSTGRPKGVAVAHAALANLYFQHRRTIFARTFEDRSPDEIVAVAHIAGLGFDASWDPLLWLVAGAQLHLVSDEVRTDAEALVRFCADNAIDVLETTPSYLRQLINSGLLTARGAGLTRPMTLALGGEAVPDDLWQEIAASESVIGYNFYGPTEFTVDSVIAEITGTEPNIGRPVHNVRAYVLDEYLGLAPQGIVGELYLAGAGSATGYAGREAETASRFVADPFTPGARMYRTGDLVRRLPDGSLAFLSRADDQVKIRGFRIELGEIENVLLSHPHVQHAAVVVDTATATERIVGYYVGDASGDELRAHAAQRLPDYMVPRILLAVPGIPLTAHGKLDRRALPDPTVAGESTRAPETADEQKVCALFGTVLGASEVGLDDDFFDLGGHSLLAVTLIAKLREAFGIELGLRTLFEAPTPAALLQAMTGRHDKNTRIDQGGVASDGANVAVTPGSVVAGSQLKLMDWAKSGRGRPAAKSTGSEHADRIPLSYAQSRLWFLNQLDPGSSDYNISLAVRLTGDLKAEALAAALDDLVQRHEVLRTIYPAPDGNPEQHILPSADVAGMLKSGTASSAAELAAMVEAAAEQGFDVRTDMPLRAVLIRLDQDEWVLHLVMHHIASDGASLAPLARDISMAYSARSGAARALQRPLALQYADFTLWQREMLDGESLATGEDDGDAHDPSARAERAAGAVTALETKLAAWRQTLAGLPAELELPADAPRPEEARQHGSQHFFAIPGTVTKALAGLAGFHNASLFMALHAALAGFLKRIGAGDDLVIGSPTAGRSDPALAELIGFFVNTVPIRLDATNNPSFRELLLRARASVLDAFDKDEVPFERLVSALNPPRKLGRHPVFQTMLTVENTPRAVIELQGVQAVVEPEIGTGEAKFDLSFTFRELGGDDGLAATLDYNASMFSPDTIRELVQRLETFIKLAVGAPDEPVARLDILPEADLAQLMTATDGPSGEAGAPAPENILDALAHTVAQQSEDTAVVFGPESLTFAQLDANSDRIARRLLAEGVTADDLVSVYLPRSLATITAVFGVLKSGGAYNPIDVDYPPERVSAILTDAAPKVVLTSRSVAAGLESPLTEIGIDQPHVVCLEDLPDAESSGAAPGAGTILPQNLAYAMFTSGSTGRPKGVEVSHGALANLLASHRSTMLPETSVGREHRRIKVAHTTGVGFDASWDPMLWMVDGHELHLIQDQLRRNPQGLAGYFAEHNIGAWETTPSYLRQLLREPAFAGLLEKRETLKPQAGKQGGTQAGTWAPLHLAIGGEAFDADLWKDLSSRSSVRAWNLYGPTEATVDSLLAEVNASDLPVLGTPVRGARAYVLDAHLQHVPAGVSGELYLAGPGLARGYRGRMDLTAERFVADPFAGGGERMYRTGDIVTRHRDGAMVFRGRNDDQIKLRGFRVELGEIDNALRSVPGVREAAVIPVDGSDGAAGAPARLVAYLVAEGTSADADDTASAASQTALEQRVLAAARTQLRSVLPGYMVPSALMAVRKMPLTAHGKLDIRALPDAVPSDGGAGLPPRTPKEKAVAQIFADVLSLPVVGVDESFFDLGGHSFLAQPLISRINDALGTDLPVQSLFRAPTVERLVAEAVKGAGESVAASLERVLPLRSTGNKAPLFAVHPASGVSWGYAAMLRRLDKDRPLIGLQMPGMGAETDTGVEAATLTEFVDDYIVQLKSVQPEGPYHLLGWSFGGNLVQRLATRLQECGDEVSFLAILDAYPTNQESNTDIGTGPALLASYLQAVGYPASTAQGRILDAERVLEILRENHNPLGNIPLASVQAMVDNFSVLARLIRSAELTKFDGDLYFFSATEQVPAGTPAADAWQPYVSGRIIDTPVSERHSQMLSEKALDDISPVLSIHLGFGTE